MFRVNWLLIAAIAFVILPGAFTSAHSAGVDTGQFKVGMVIGGASYKHRAVQREARYTCGAARAKIQIAGFKEIGNLECNGSVYTFTASYNSTRNNFRFNASNGKIASY